MCSGARVMLVAPELSATLRLAVAAGTYRHREGAFAGPDTEGCTLVIAATDDRAVNARVAEAARARRIPVNVVDDAELSTFIVPAIVDRSPVQIAISTGGRYNIAVVEVLAPPHAIAGRVSPAGIASHAGITVSGPVTRTVTADATGAYSIPGLPDGDYTLQPSAPGVVFKPERSRIRVAGAAVAGVDFSASVRPAAVPGPGLEPWEIGLFALPFVALLLLFARRSLRTK